MNKKKFTIYFVTAFVVSVIVLVACTFFGTADITFAQTCQILLNKLFGLFAEEVDALGSKDTIVWMLRFPRTLLAFLVGGTLSICGGVYQAIFKNPMADPYVLGISSGAAFGATIGMVFNISGTFFGQNMISILAFVFATLTVFFVYNIAKVGRSAHITSLLLSGTAVSQFLTAIISFLMLIYTTDMKKIYSWTLGSFSAKSWDHVAVVIPYIIIGSVIIFTYCRDLDIIMLGDDTAIRYGVNTEKTKKMLFLITALTMSACVSVSGIIGFVGLISPHIVRLFTGPKHKQLLPLSFLFGGVVMSVCDTIARSVLGSEIPVGIVTAIIGAPFFIYLLRAKKTEVM